MKIINTQTHNTLNNISYTNSFVHKILIAINKVRKRCTAQFLPSRELMCELLSLQYTNTPKVQGGDRVHFSLR